MHEWARGRVGDIAITCLAAAGAFEFALLGDPALSGAAVAWTIPLWWRRRHPLWAPMAAVGLLSAVTASASFPSFPGTPVVVLIAASWWIGLFNPVRRAVPAVAVATAVSIAAAGLTTRSVVETILLLVMPCLAGLTVSRHQRQTGVLTTVVEDLRVSQPHALRMSVDEERARIARELHDVVTSSVSAMTIQAGAARMLLPLDQRRARESVAHVQEAGRDALAELRRLLDVLGGGPSALDGAVPAPQPGLTDVPMLLERACRAGVEVTFSETGQPGDYDSGVELTTYRVLQEALSNVLKHAGRTTARVALHHTGDAIELDVTNDGPLTPTDPAGHGLVGMRERVGLHGGELVTGPVAAGYRVRARLPIAT